MLRPMAKGLGFLLLAAVIAAVFVSIALWRNRRRLAAAADEAAVATLAAGVRVSRKLGGAAASYRDRIIAKADERGSPPPR